MRTETDPWWRQAQADLETAGVLLKCQRYYAVSWFVQQAVEKGLKALYIEHRGVLAPRTHNLVFLGNEVAAPADVAADLAGLNPIFDATRYPGPLGGDCTG
jgi:HEPN domain-containing protein